MKVGQAQAARRLTCARRCNVSGSLLSRLLLRAQLHLQVVVATSEQRVCTIALFVVCVPELGMPGMPDRRPGVWRAGRLAHRRCCVRSHTTARAARRTRAGTSTSDACRLLLRGRSLETNTLVTSERRVANALHRPSDHRRARRARRCKSTEALLSRGRHSKQLLIRGG